MVPSMQPPSGPGILPAFRHDDRGRAASRHLCVGVYQDRSFRDEVLRRVYCDRHHRVAPSYGFDLVPVLVHAWRSWFLDKAQHAVILVALAVTAVTARLEFFICVSVLLVWYIIKTFAPLLKDIAAYFKQRESISAYKQLQIRGKLFWYGFLASIAILGFGIFQLVGKIHPQALTEAWSLRNLIIGPLILIGLITVVSSISAALRQLWMNRLRHASSMLRQNRGRLAAIDEQQFHPFTVYSGFNPFIGAGRAVRTWSFAQRLVPSSPLGMQSGNEYAAPPFQTRELVERLKTRIEELRLDEHPETRLPGLEVADHIFVEGTYADGYRYALQNAMVGPPLQSAVTDIIDNPRESARHFLRCQVSSWGGEVVTSVFVHVSLQGRTLYIEFATHALPPTLSDYQIIDEFGEAGVTAIARAVLRAVIALPDALEGIIRLVATPRLALRSWLARRDATMKARRGVNIGARFSAREEASSSDESYFQLLDIFKHSKIIERRLLAAVGDFLKQWGVDTSEFLARATSILNNGIINSGTGTINIESSAFGQAPNVINTASAPGSNAV